MCRAAGGREHDGVVGSRGTPKSGGTTSGEQFFRIFVMQQNEEFLSRSRISVHLSNKGPRLRVCVVLVADVDVEGAKLKVRCQVLDAVQVVYVLNTRLYLHEANGRGPARGEVTGAAPLVREQSISRDFPIGFSISYLSI